MPVDSKDKTHIDQAPAWGFMRDLVAGQRVVHAKGECYLPRLSGESDDDFKARIKRATFFNATWRTIEALVGMLFRKPPAVTVSPAAEGMLADVTKSGQAFPAFGERAAEELETVGRVGLLVDYPQTSTAGLTVAQAQELNVRPHLALYRSESILNARYAWINNRTVLSLVVLEETVEEPGKDKYTPSTVTQWRELELVPVTVGDVTRHLYHVGIKRKDANGAEYYHVQPFMPMMGGQPMTEIPFEIVGDGVPPLEDLARVNESHYHTTADLEHGAHKTALPQPWVAGLDERVDAEGRPVDRTLKIGGGHAWALPQGATVGMLEYTGQGLAALEKRLDVKERQMAVLGARMLEQQKSGVETAETAGIHRSGEQSILQNHADALSAAFTRVLTWFDKWAGGPGTDVSAAVNKDFLPATLDAQAITALVGAWQQGAISKEQLFLKLQKGGVVSDGADFEDEETKIANAPPVLSAGAV